MVKIPFRPNFLTFAVTIVSIQKWFRHFLRSLALALFGVNKYGAEMKNSILLFWSSPLTGIS